MSSHAHALLALVVGLILGTAPVVGMWLVGLWKKRERGRVPDGPPNYGFKNPPQEVLRKRLVAAPLGYAWESWVEYDRNGYPNLTLSLMDVAAGKSVARNSTQIGGKSWYVSGLVGWAEREALKHSPKVGTREGYQVMTDE